MCKSRFFIIIFIVMLFFVASNSVLASSLSPPYVDLPDGQAEGPVIRFKWARVEGARKYALYIYEAPYNQNNIIYSNENIDGSAHKTDVNCESFSNGREYRWNMRACNEEGWSDYSDMKSFVLTLPPASFIMGPKETPVSGFSSSHVSDIPMPAMPDNFKDTGVWIMVDKTPVFKWNIVESAEKYAIYIYEKPYRKKDLIYSIESINSTTYRYQLPDGIIKNGGEYGLKMRSYGSGEWSSYSDMLSFRLDIPGMDNEAAGEEDKDKGIIDSLSDAAKDILEGISNFLGFGKKDEQTDAEQAQDNNGAYGEDYIFDGYEPLPGPKDATTDGDKTVTGSMAEFKQKFLPLIIEETRGLNISIEALVACIFVESGGKGFQDGRPLIRFENHVFLRMAPEYRELFYYNKDGQPWTDHKYRKEAAQEYIYQHNTGQKGEYEEFEFALTLNEKAAYESISMGMGQIMGFNYELAGYSSAKQMYEDYCRGNKQQITGILNFLKNSGNGILMSALQPGNVNYDIFITRYNGTGKIEQYRIDMLEAEEAFRSIE